MTKMESLNDIKAGLTSPYHKGLDRGNKYHLAFGLQGVYNSSSLDVNSVFADQIGLDGTIADMSMEQTNGFASSTNSFFDVNVGLLFDAQINSKLRCIWVDLSLHNSPAKRLYRCLVTTTTMLYQEDM